MAALEPKTVDAIVARWRSSGYYAPRAPAPEDERKRFLADARKRCGFVVPDDYARFLELCDGGQFDAAFLFGCTRETGSHLDTGDVLAIGDSGNVDVYVLRPDGRAEIVGLGGLDHAFESFPSFTALLDRLIRAGR